MISKFGEFNRDIRKTNGESLRTMASRLGISAAFLSIMEVGRKNIPLEYVNKICDEYNLDETKKIELENAIIETNKHVDIEIDKMNEAQKEISMMFARKIKNANGELIEKLRKALEDDKDQSDKR